jgi:hypothetical protein
MTLEIRYRERELYLDYAMARWDDDGGGLGGRTESTAESGALQGISILTPSRGEEA